jgi:predicted enzyme related to lactoylglutathione lyase
MTTQQTAARNGAAVIGMDLAAYYTGDPQRAIAFYRDVIGITPTEIDEEGRGAEFTLADGTTFGVWRPDEGPFVGGAVMFAVGDIDAAIAQLRERNVAISDAETTPVCRMAFCQDPDGNPIIIHQRKVRD